MQLESDEVRWPEFFFLFRANRLNFFLAARADLALNILSYSTGIHYLGSSMPKLQRSRSAKSFRLTLETLCSMKSSASYALIPMTSLNPIFWSSLKKILNLYLMIELGSCRLKTFSITVVSSMQIFGPVD
jgi:hypothetical protein